jgi:hypothetical protein
MKKIILICSAFLLCIVIGNAQCNLNFETGNFSGWTITKGSPSLMTNYTMTGCCATPGSTAVTVFPTPFNDPYLGVVPHSPLGGSFVAQVNNSNQNGNASRITNTFMVTSNSIFQFAIAAVVDGILEGCESIAYAHVRVLDAGGSPIYSVHHVPNGANTATCSSSAFTNTVTNKAFFCWQTYTVNLAPYIGTNVSVEVTGANCGGYGHWAYCYFDAACTAVTPTNVSCSFSSGFDEIIETAPITIWPNPAKDVLNISVKSPSPETELLVFDILGNTVLRQRDLGENSSINIERLSQGAYFYKLTSGDKVKSGKFLKN